MPLATKTSRRSLAMASSTSVSGFARRTVPITSPPRETGMATYIIRCRRVLLHRVAATARPLLSASRSSGRSEWLSTESSCERSSSESPSTSPSRLTIVTRPPARFPSSWATRSHGARSSILADADGQIADAHSISAGLDYPGVGPEHAALRDSGRAEYVPCTDDEALAAFHRLAETEGIIPALESSHALARALDLEEQLVLVCLSGRGDKDLAEVLAR